MFKASAGRDNADEPLGIVTRKGTGINAGKVADLKGKRIGLARGQTSTNISRWCCAAPA